MLLLLDLYLIILSYSIFSSSKTAPPLEEVIEALNLVKEKAIWKKNIEQQVTNMDLDELNNWN